MESVTLGIRIPKELKLRFDQYCDSRGMKKNFLLAKIIEEKLLEFTEDEDDLVLAEKRLEEPRVDEREIRQLLRRKTTR
ncbi:MAG: hypothetical protein PHQ23_01980 [Candidatus Wallbacteria bacterium]|nr:hypothetical protein [Candidatus Wallbacteria bacterium]